MGKQQQHACDWCNGVFPNCVFDKSEEDVKHCGVPGCVFHTQREAMFLNDTQKAQVGVQVFVWWSGERTFFRGKVEEVAEVGGVVYHHILYDDGDECWENLKEQNFITCGVFKKEQEQEEEYIPPVNKRLCVSTEELEDLTDTAHMEVLNNTINHRRRDRNPLQRSGVSEFERTSCLHPHAASGHCTGCGFTYNPGLCVWISKKDQQMMGA